MQGLGTPKGTIAIVVGGKITFRGLATVRYTGVNFVIQATGRLHPLGIVAFSFPEPTPVADGIPINVAAAEPICEGGFYCPDDANPPEYSCKKKRFLFAPADLKNGFIKKNASGAYASAMTVCHRRLNPIRLSEVAHNPNTFPVALPESQIVNV